MAKRLTVYLFYYKEIPEPDTWDYKFSYYFNMIVTQIMGVEPQMFSNLDISCSKMLPVDKLDTNTLDAFILIQNTIDIGLKFKRLADISPGLGSFSNIKTYQVIKKGSKTALNTNSGSPYAQYKFYELNHHSLQILHYDPDLIGDSENGFWERLMDLTYDIKISAVDVLHDSTRVNSIFLAEVSDDQVKNRDKIKRELLLLGYRVLPVTPLPQKLEDFENTVSGLLLESVLSINILGELYGESPQLADYSYVEIQNKLFEKEYAIQKKTPIEPKLNRIFWTQPVLEVTEEKQDQYLKRIQKETFSLSNTEFVQSSISDLVTIVEKKIKQLKYEGFEFITEEQKVSTFLIIDHLEDEYKQVIIDKFKTANLTCQLHEIQDFLIHSMSELMSKFKFQDKFLLINTQKNNSWVSSMISLIVRSKGLAGALPLSSLVLLSNEPERNYDYLAPIEVQYSRIHFKKFEEQVNTILLKLKV